MKAVNNITKTLLVAAALTLTMAGCGQRNASDQSAGATGGGTPGSASSSSGGSGTMGSSGAAGGSSGSSAK
ncbi:hypothetical protein SAMN06265795_102355 [Noviherbaspirillum humi]|uniref:Uncharacterized protein n=1 Tax=Noviherbaspirillum humi TaxID=1688639 RepID=A0A239DT13_9BURK|nr:hypothetical protein [Noviherbaspirillum humi]SNS35650.1 hypothetical protein SAMN06265795_102355 [Noviherbaspirillum humi]